MLARLAGAPGPTDPVRATDTNRAAPIGETRGLGRHGLSGQGTHRTGRRRAIVPRRHRGGVAERSRDLHRSEVVREIALRQAQRHGRPPNRPIILRSKQHFLAMIAAFGHFEAVQRAGRRDPQPRSQYHRPAAHRRRSPALGRVRGPRPRRGAGHAVAPRSAHLVSAAPLRACGGSQ